jgi:glutathione S-transferase
VKNKVISINGELPMKDKIKLYSAWYCPFAQRALITLLHKGIEFQLIETDPYDKTPEWMNVSAGSGQVPVIEYDSGNSTKKTLINSLSIMAFIDGYYVEEDKIIFSNNPIKINEEKFWMEYASNNIIPYFYRYLKADKPGKLRYDAMTQMLTGINNFTKNMAIEGPFFSGKKFGAVDIAFAPFAYRINLLLGYYRNFNLSDKSDDWFRYKQWYEAVIAQPSFIKSIFEQKDYESRLIDFYLPYSLGGGQTDVTDINADITTA